jgi:hypothetical protein
MTIEVNLRGPGGNAMHLMRLASDLGRQCGYDRATIDRITSAMRSGTYANVLDTLEREFPGLDFVFDGDPRKEAAGSAA